MIQLKLMTIVIVIFSIFARNSPSKENDNKTQPMNENFATGKTDSPPFKNGITLETSGFPPTVFIGDTFYHLCVVSNNNASQSVFDGGDLSITEGARFMEGFRFLFSAVDITEQYDCVPEIYCDKYANRIGSRVTLAPGESIASAHPLEFPPLQAWEHPFWKQVREKMAPDGIKCTLNVKIPERYIDNSVYPYPPGYRDYSLDILLKPRPEKEMELLEKWYRDTPKQFFPPVCSTQIDDEKWWYSEEMDEFEKTGYHRCNGNLIELGGEKYNPWCFIRENARKPPAVTCPVTIEGWKELEESLVPSTMRDEITLVRLQLEYFSAPENEREKPLRDIIRWLETLPEPQRMSMASSLHANTPMGRLHDLSDQAMIDRLAPARRELFRAILPLMSHYHREGVKKTWPGSEEK